MNAWAAAAYLVERGVPSRLAHEAVGKAVQFACGTRMRSAKASRSPTCKRSTQAFDAGFHSCLGLTEVLALHDLPGGTAPRHVKRALQSARERVSSLRSPEPLAAR